MLSEYDVVEELETCCKVLFGTGEVATHMAHQHLFRVQVPEHGRIGFAQSKLKRLVGQRTGDGQVARGVTVEAPQRHRPNQLPETAALLRQYPSSRLSRSRDSGSKFSRAKAC